jgi:SAM-dependent methyltransferase
MLMERGAQEVAGFDLSQEAIKEARAFYRVQGLRFEVANALNLPLEDHTSDVFVSLETIEHIENEHAFLREVVRVLKPGGSFICSTPNRVLTNPGTCITNRPFNPYHVREYTAGELDLLLRPFFSSIAFFGQTPYWMGYARLLNRLGRTLPMAAVRLHQMRKLIGVPREREGRHYPAPLPMQGEPEVLIAICTT